MRFNLGKEESSIAQTSSEPETQSATKNTDNIPTISSATPKNQESSVSHYFVFILIK